jgi:hypothetical protein
MMNGKISVCGIVLLCLLVVESCAHVGASADNRSRYPIESFMPLAVGNQWIYTTSFQRQPQADLKVSITKEEGGYFYDDRPSPSRLRFDGSGLRDGEIRYLLKNPLARGQKWMSVADVKTVEHYEIEAIGQDVRVPAGTFSDCVIVRTEVKLDRRRAMLNYLVFAPSVGIIEIRTALKTDADLHEQSMLQLKSYHLTPTHTAAP